jgi:ribosomal protein S6
MFNQLKDVLNKFNVKIKNANIWAEKRKLYFELSIKGKSAKFREGLYYLIEFESLPTEIAKITSAYRLNENILRFLISADNEIKEEANHGKLK